MLVIGAIIRLLSFFLSVVVVAVFLILLPCILVNKDVYKASGVEFCTVVHARPGQVFSHFGELCSPEAQNKTIRPPTRK